MSYSAHLTAFEIVYSIVESKSDLAFEQKRGELDRALENVDVNQILPSIKCPLLHFAVFHQSYRLVEYLLSKGANPGIICCGNKTALHMTNNIPITKMLLQAINYNKDVINVQDELGETVLHSAIFEKNVQLIELYLTHGANPNLKLNCSATAWDIRPNNPEYKSYLENFTWKEYLDQHNQERQMGEAMIAQ